ncbi:protein-disulfide reductase DsbD [Labrys monachus]|uniref:Thiol:disulfide interchange protein DsbD n=1 Tax=Labrys monachus TaxID=217067 RepID=A0ABU0F9M1_9HYPH|nr:protein-disulfide reductase DsbD [Labrys monachus]MDQ0391315.1 thiol:disulfide interchange protein DsbD [Labrys monachus]
MPIRKIAKAGATLLLAYGSLALAFQACAAPPRAADQVFSLKAERADPHILGLTWDIAPGNYLYRDALKATLDGQPVAMETPAGHEKDDPNFGTVQIYRGRVAATVTGVPAEGRLQVVFQGCADEGICYPPVVENVDLRTLDIIEAKSGLPVRSAEPASFPADGGMTAQPASSGGLDAATVLQGNGLAMLAAFMGFGFLLSLTPCVLPMIPVLAAMLAGSGARLSARRGFVLSGTYVLAMAAAYGLVGLVAGWTGANLQAALQTPWALGAAAILFLALALSMLGVFDMALPSGLARRLSAKGRAGSVPGAMLLGFGSALIVGPCVTPPLAAAMLYAVQTGEAAKGGAALFALGLGMGLPLLAAGTFGSRILPKAGPWLEHVKPAFAVVFLAVAVMLVTRMVPPAAGLAIWGAFAIAMGVFVGGFDRLDPSSGWNARLCKAAGLTVCIYGASLLVGAAAGTTDMWRPLAFLSGSSAEANAREAEARVSSPVAFDRALSRSEAWGKPILVSFTADWCTVCRSNEAIMNEPALRRRLEALPRIVADATSYDDAVRDLLARFGVVGPPTLLLLDANGREIAGTRLVGPVTAQDIERRLAQAGA